MKIYLGLLLATLTLTSILHAQKNKSEPENDYTYRSERNLDPDVVAKLKATKTVFFLSDDSSPTADSFKQAIKSAWTITPISFDNYSNFAKYSSDKSYSYFMIETGVLMAGNFTFTHYYLTLKLFKDVDKKGNINSYGLCHIELSPDYQKSLEINGNNRTSLSPEAILKNNLFHNWIPSVIKAHLTTVAEDIELNRRSSLFKEIKDAQLRSILSKNTLYIPQRFMLESKSTSYKRKPIEDNIFESYLYKYKICTDEQLYKIFETDKTGVLLFEFLHCEGQKWVTIIDVKNKKKVYMLYTPRSRNISNKDIEKIVE